MIADRISDIQAALQEEGLEAWFFSCFQHNDPISLDLLGLSGDRLVTRRCYYLVPAVGDPKKLVHELEPAMLDHLPGTKASYLSWQQHHERLGELVAGLGRTAAQYSPGNELPTVSRLDAGTAELLRSAGLELVSSADLAQRFAAVWSGSQLEGHRRSNVILHRLALAAFDQVGQALRADRLIDEYRVQQFLLENFDREGLWTESSPIVGVNQHSADPHYQPSAEHKSSIELGDFLLIDLWAKEKHPNSVYADITWCGVCAEAPTDRHQEIFSIVAGARDAALDLVKSRFPAEAIRGYEVDDAARGVIEDAGYGEFYIHRTGHSIGISDHGQGANMDNLETHDTRSLMPMTGFSIEPGIYLPTEFGVRSEINVALTANDVEVTGAEPQRELVRVLGA